MQDLPSILNSWGACLRAGEEAVLATVVQVQGSAFRHPGAKMLIRQDRSVTGSVSGPCLESTIRSRAWWWTDAGPAVIPLATDPYDDRTTGRTGCGGGIHLLVERVHSQSPGPLAFLAAATQNRQAAVFGTVIRAGSRTDCGVGDRIFYSPCKEACSLLIKHRSRIVNSDGGSQLFFETVLPPRRLVLIGAGRDAEALAALAQRLSWELIVIDGREDPRTRSRFLSANRVLLGDVQACLDSLDLTGAAIVIMSHSLDIDSAALSHLMLSAAAYIGVMGPRRRTGDILEQLQLAAPAHVHFPAGLPIGSETEAEIALSIAAEIQAVWNGRILESQPALSNAKRKIAV